MGAKKKKGGGGMPVKSRSESSLRCRQCDSRINDFGGCDGCGRALDTEELALGVRPAVNNSESNFAVRFTSPTLRIIVGPAKTEYYLHKEILISKSPYFSALLSSSFVGIEVASGTVTLNTGVDTDDAFQMLVEYLYHSNYNPPGEAGRDSDCLLHVGVYVLAERLCMEDLKSLAFRKLFKELARVELYMSGAQLLSSTVAQLAETLYENTPSPHPQSCDDGMSTGGPSQEGPVSPGPNHVKTGVPEDERRDKMRTLVARYAASKLVQMTKDPSFMAAVRNSGEFAEDLILATARGGDIEFDELERL
ncbi:MAG: hypothetical protein M1839_008378 [Geoglossum umbratile]|nr:MAG: hypothetical protein M1839_008378 [Geoglossum umbratile]